MFPFNQLNPAIESGMVLSEGTIHFSKWHPPVCNIENSYERGMLL
jgi:hypothetical protein